MVEPTHLRFPPVGLTAVHNTGFLEVVRRAAERDERQEMTSCECSLLLPERGDLPIGGRSDSNKGYSLEVSSQGSCNSAWRLSYSGDGRYSSTTQPELRCQLSRLD
jgi:hypothetical protein